MDEPEPLAHAIGDREPRDRLAVPDRHDLEAEDAVEAIGLLDDLAPDLRHPYGQMITSAPGRSANSPSTNALRRSSAARWLT